jgi:hypothetical protein
MKSVFRRVIPRWHRSGISHEYDVGLDWYFRHVSFRNLTGSKRENKLYKKKGLYWSVLSSGTLHHVVSSESKNKPIKKNVPPKRQSTLNRLHGFLSQKIKLFTTTDVRILNFTYERRESFLSWDHSAGARVESRGKTLHIFSLDAACTASRSARITPEE